MVSSKQVPLSEAYWFQEGPGVRNWQFTTSGVKLLNVGNITKDGNIDLDKTDKHISLEEAEGKYSHFLVDEGDLVIASSGISFDEDGMLRTRGAFIEKKHLPLCLNTSTIRFKAIDGVSDLNFFKFWLDSFEFRNQVSRLVTGSAQQNFGPSHLKAINISLPPLTEQKRIASLLARADRLRHLRRTAHDLGESLLQSVFLEMFGDPKTNPMGWKKAKLGDVVTSIQDGPHVSPEYTENGIPFLSTRNVRPGQLIWEDMKYISEENAQTFWKRKGSKPEKGDILYTKGGTTGYAKVVDFDRQVAVWVHIAVLKLRNNLVNPLWLENMLNSEYCYKQSQELTFGIVNRDFGILRMPRVEIYLPPLSLQEEFAGVVARVESLRGRMGESMRQVEGLFESLLNQSFNFIGE